MGASFLRWLHLLQVKPPPQFLTNLFNKKFSLIKVPGKDRSLVGVISQVRLPKLGIYYLFWKTFNLTSMYSQSYWGKLTTYCYQIYVNFNASIIDDEDSWIGLFKHLVGTYNKLPLFMINLLNSTCKWICWESIFNSENNKTEKESYLM